jgi:serine/threonine protein kinase
MACVLAEMVTGRVLFTAPSNVEQMLEIIKLLGTPSREQILAMNPESELKLALPEIPATDWSKHLRGRVDPDLGDLLARLLVYDPESRLTPRQALAHKFFM